MFRYRKTRATHRHSRSTHDVDILLTKDASTPSLILDICVLKRSSDPCHQDLHHCGMSFHERTLLLGLSFSLRPLVTVEPKFFHLVTTAVQEHSSSLPPPCDKRVILARSIWTITVIAGRKVTWKSHHSVLGLWRGDSPGSVPRHITRDCRRISHLMRITSD